VKKLLGLLGWLGVALVVAAVLLRFGARPDWSTWAPDWSRGLAIAGLVVTGLYGLSQWRDIARTFEGRNVRIGSIALGSILAVLAILVGLNWIASREDKRWDLSSGGQFLLSPQTQQIVRNLKGPVQIRVYYDSSSDTAQHYKDEITEYQYYSKQISAEYIDAAHDPMRARADKVDAVPTIVMAYDGKTERATSADEQALTNALKKLLEGQAKKVYFITGHGEHDTDESSAHGYSAFTDALKSDNFDVAKLALAQTGKIPDDATVVVVAGPKLDFLAPEVEALRVYLKKGGKLLLMLDPPDKLDSPPLANLVGLARDWGIDVGTNVVIDTSGMGQLVGIGNAVTPIAMPSPGGNPITQSIAREITAFPIARSVTPIEGGANGHVAQRLVETSTQSWAETDLKDLYASGDSQNRKPPELNADKGDLPGPVSLAASVSATAPDAPPAASPDLPKPETRVVVVGDSDFAGNNAIGVQANRDLGTNMVDWLAQQEDLIAIRPKSPENRPLTMTKDQVDIMGWLTLAIIPLLLIGNGALVWWRRR